MGSIWGAVQELTAHTLSNPDDQRLAEIVKKETTRLDGILQEFLDFARMRPPTFQAQNLLEPIEEVAMLLGQSSKGVRIFVEPPSQEAAFPVWVDADLLRQRNVGCEVGDNRAGEQRAIRLLNGEKPCRMTHRQVA